MTDRVGQQLGNYELIQYLGQGHLPQSTWATIFISTRKLRLKCCILSWQEML